jgi:hypothetical protein
MNILFRTVVALLAALSLISCIEEETNEVIDGSTVNTTYWVNKYLNLSSEIVIPEGAVTHFVRNNEGDLEVTDIDYCAMENPPSGSYNYGLWYHYDYDNKDYFFKKIRQCSPNIIYVVDGTRKLEEKISINVTHSIECENCIDSSQDIFYISNANNVGLLSSALWVSGPTWDGWKSFKRITIPDASNSFSETNFTKEKYNGDGIYIFPKNNSLGITAGEPAYNCYKVVSRNPYHINNLTSTETVTVRCSGYVDPVYYRQEEVPNINVF